jgi:hypothetical protein
LHHETVDSIAKRTFQNPAVEDAFMSSTQSEEGQDDVLEGNLFDIWSNNFPHHSKCLICKRSKFYEVFDEIVKMEKDKNQLESPSTSFTTNPLCVENFVKFITAKYMAYTPFWTAVVTGKRFSNSIGELFFRIMKHIYFPKRKIEISTFVKEQHQNIQNLVTRTEFNDVVKNRKKDP